jgi:hypothetical protein
VTRKIVKLVGRSFVCGIVLWCRREGEWALYDNSLSIFGSEGCWQGVWLEYVVRFGNKLSFGKVVGSCGGVV